MQRRGSYNTFRLPALISAFLAVVVFACPGTGSAQSYAADIASIFPMAGLERYIGELIPRGSLANTFRSETGATFSFSEVQRARLTVPGIGDVDLDGPMRLNRFPYKYDVYGNLRLWRFGLRGMYSNFETASSLAGRGQFDIGGLILGGDVDLVYHEWVGAGVGADFYFVDPRLQAFLDTDLDGTVDSTVDVKGTRPIVAGPYIRYVPPEILGFPMHFEAFWKLPVSGAQLQTFGAALVFRPQIYRFDIAAKVSVEKTFLEFTGNDDVTNTDLDVNMEWDFLGMTGVIYF